MDWPTLSETQRLDRLERPAGRPRIVLDTDTFNEIDDQFALVYAMLSQDQLDVTAITAAPFHNTRSSGPADGMEKSHAEILRVLDRLNHPSDDLVWRGAGSYLPAADRPADSPAAGRIIELAMSNSDPLYVLAVGAATNVATALLLEPRILRRIVVVWLGGHPTNHHTTEEFNLRQDVHAARVLFDSGVPLVHVPCRNVAEHLRTTQAELHKYVAGHGPVGDYLSTIYDGYMADHYGRSKVIWDVAVVAWMLDDAWVPTHLLHSPLLNDGLTWSHDPRRHFVREAVHCDRDAIFSDLFRKIEAAGGQAG